MRKCKAEGCDLKHHALGYCRKHHTRFIRNGTAESKYDMDSYSNVNDMRDPRPGHRGTYAVNIINDIKYKARQRGKSWQLSHTEAFSVITSPCFYCGFKPQWPHNRVGIDRIQNGGPYTIYNVVPCCFTCNSAKGQMTMDQFEDWIKRIYKIIILKES